MTIIERLNAIRATIWFPCCVKQGLIWKCISALITRKKYGINTPLCRCDGSTTWHCAIALTPLWPIAMMRALEAGR